MAQRTVVFFFLLGMFEYGDLASCSKTKIQIWSSTKCVAGRRFFARFDHIPAVYRTFSKKPVQPYIFPWIAEVQVAYHGKQKTCTGTLINDRYVLTAQHCVLPPIEANHVTVKLGYHKGYKPDDSSIFQPLVLERNVLEIIRHPDYEKDESENIENDLALLRITPVKYSKTIYPIQLPSLMDTRKTYSNVKAENVDWVFSTNGKQFKQREVTILDSEHCNSYHSYFTKNTTSGILCSLANKDDHGKCFSESGGPLMKEEEKKVYKKTVLLGIATWSFSQHQKTCVRAHFPVIYVRIDNKLDWIKKNTMDAIYCHY